MTLFLANPCSILRKFKYREQERLAMSKIQQLLQSSQPRLSNSILPSFLVLLAQCSFSVNTYAESATEQAKQIVVGNDTQRDLSVTVYNDNFALVREARELVLPKGLVELEFQDVPKTIDPTSVTVKSVDQPDQFSVLEQNYRYDLLNRTTLLSKFVGRKLKYSRSVLTGSSYETSFREGSLLALDPEIVDFGDEIEIEPEGTITLSSVPEELTSKPTLVWLLENQVHGAQLLETSYLANRISWQADYIAVLDDEAGQFDLSAWVTMNNRSGARFHDAQIKLVAGDVNRVKTDEQVREMRFTSPARAMSDEMAQQESFFEYHLYTLPRKTTLANNETKQINLMSADGVGFTKEYVLLSQAGNQRRAQIGESKFDVKLKFDNREKNKLGMPLPAGRVRVYQEDSSGALQLVGEDRVKHTPEDETVTLSVGKAFDLVAERRQTAYRRIGDKGIEVSYEITVRNQKRENVSAIVQERMFGDWIISGENLKGVRLDAATYEFKFDVKAKSARTIKYTARMTY